MAGGGGVTPIDSLALRCGESEIKREQFSHHCSILIYTPSYSHICVCVCVEG